MKTSTLKKPAADAPALKEIDALCAQLKEAMRTSVDVALRIGLRLLIIHRQAGSEDGGFRSALERVEGHRIPRSTAYRWINAAGRIMANHQGICNDQGEFDPLELKLPEPGTIAFSTAEKHLAAAAAGTSMRRLMLGSASTSDESRMDALITASESGDVLADEVLEKVAKGELTLVQAIRAKAGAQATRGKERKDPVYLDIDGSTGQPCGLFVKSLVTLKHTFERWDDLNETARRAAKDAWKELIVRAPKELIR